MDIIDSVLEDIRLGMESLNHRTNQRRTAMVKFLGEMYNYRLIDSALVFKVLKRILSDRGKVSWLLQAQSKACRTTNKAPLILYTF